MLQSILSAIFLYHIIKAIRRARNKAAPSKKPAPTPTSAAVNTATPGPERTQTEAALRQVLGNRPWADTLIEVVRKPMGVRNVILGAIFFVVGLLITLAMAAVIVSDLNASTNDDTLIGGGIAIVIGLGTCWMGVAFWRDGMKMLRIHPRETVITGATRYEAAKPQPPIKTQKKPDKQFEQL